MLFWFFNYDDFPSSYNVLNVAFWACSKVFSIFCWVVYSIEVESIEVE